jgi:hypothetical protein
MQKRFKKSFTQSGESSFSEALSLSQLEAVILTALGDKRSLHPEQG